MKAEGPQAPASPCLEPQSLAQCGTGTGTVTRKHDAREAARAFPEATPCRRCLRRTSAFGKPVTPLTPTFQSFPLGGADIP